MGGGGGREGEGEREGGWRGRQTGGWVVGRAGDGEIANVHAFAI